MTNQITRPPWFNTLHQSAYVRTDEFWRLGRTISDQPDVIRDLLKLKLIECKQVFKIDKTPVRFYRRVT